MKPTTDISGCYGTYVAHTLSMPLFRDRGLGISQNQSLLGGTIVIAMAVTHST